MSLLFVAGVLGLHLAPGCAPDSRMVAYWNTASHSLAFLACSTAASCRSSHKRTEVHPWQITSTRDSSSCCAAHPRRMDGTGRGLDAESSQTLKKNCLP